MVIAEDQDHYELASEQGARESRKLTWKTNNWAQE